MAARGRTLGIAGIVLLAALGATLVTLTLRRPSVPTYAPTRAEPRDAGRALVGPVVYTVDATAPDRWRYFSFARGAVVEDPGPRDWDLAFKRYQIIANGGARFAGEAGLRDLGEVPFAAVHEVPADGYAGTEGPPDDPRHPAIAGWYHYGFFSHVLTPRPRVWAVRTADGRHAKLEILGYYCTGAEPGCLTFRYVFQGDGSRAVAPGPRVTISGVAATAARGTTCTRRARA
jgi:hypothetical protein